MIKKFKKLDTSKLFYHDDGLLVQEVGRWTVDKYILLYLYLEMFSTGIKNRFVNRIYVDLFSGSGCSKLESDEVVYKGSPLLSLSVPDKFTKYIFCEKDKDSADALEKRIFDYPSFNIKLFKEDINNCINDILKEIPKNNSLTCCFVDPWSIDINFGIIEKLSANRKIDFIILLALGMDVKRNEKLYIENQNKRIDRLLGSNDWRKEWKEKEFEGEKFSRFVGEVFSKKMFSIGYLKDPKQMRIFKYDQKNVPLYYIAFYSKDKLGYKYWHESMKYESDQEELDLFN